RFQASSRLDITSMRGESASPSSLASHTIAGPLCMTRWPPTSQELRYDHTLVHTLSMRASERVTVTLRSDLLEEIDRMERNRSRFIAEAVEHELKRRRREALLQSVVNPHPETAELADVGIGD